MLSNAIISATVLAEAAMAVKIYSTADIGTDVSSQSESFDYFAQTAMAQIDAASESLQG